MLFNMGLESGFESPLPDLSMVSSIVCMDAIRAIYDTLELQILGKVLQCDIITSGSVTYVLKCKRISAFFSRVFCPRQNCVGVSLLFEHLDGHLSTRVFWWGSSY